MLKGLGNSRDLSRLASQMMKNCQLKKQFYEQAKFKVIQNSSSTLLEERESAWNEYKHAVKRLSEIEEMLMAHLENIVRS